MPGDTPRRYAASTDIAEQAIATATPDEMPAGEVCCGLLNPALAKLQPGTAGPSGTLTGLRKAFCPVASHHHTTAGPAFRGGVRPRFFQGPERKARFRPKSRAPGRPF